MSLHGWAGVAQVGVICGIVAGALAPGVVTAAAAGLIAGFVGGFGLLAWFVGGDLLMAGAFAVVTALAAAAAALLLARTRVTQTMLALVAVALVIAGMWSLTFTALHTPPPYPGQPTSIERLEQRPTAGEKWGDGTLFRAVVFKMRDGSSYYDAYRWAFDNNGFTLRDPANVLQVRPPALFWYWALLPAWPVSLIYSVLILASVACVACVGIARGLTSPVLGVAAAAAIAALSMVTAESTNNVTNIELTGGLLAVLVLYAVLHAASSRRRAAWVIAAAALSFLTVTTRELMIYLPVFGLLAAFFSAAEHRRFDLIAWGSSFAASVAALLLHFRAASRIVTPVPGSVASTWIGGGSLKFMLAGISNNTLLFSAAWVPFALVVLGIIGAACVPNASARVFAVCVAVAPLASFLVIGNENISRDFVLDRSVNYWGGIVVPAIFALAPLAFSLLTGPRFALAARSESLRLTEPATSH